MVTHSSLWNGFHLLQHPNFTFGVLRSTYNDYSLLELSQPVTLSNITNLVCLPNEHEDENLNGIPITVTGWGKIDYDADGPNDLLMKATVQQASFAMCTEVYEQMKVNINEYNDKLYFFLSGFNSFLGIISDRNSALKTNEYRIFIMI